jgi:hypothetical protein
MQTIIRMTLILSALLYISCNTPTAIISSWREPGTEVTIEKLNKVLVVAMLRNETNRRTAEDQMVSWMKGKGIASYNYLDAVVNSRNENEMRQLIRADGFDGAITMRLVDMEKEQLYTPGNTVMYPSLHRNFSGYYYRNWPRYTTPGYYTETKIYTVETNVYSIREDKIIWSGLTETTDPDGVTKMTDQIAKVVYKRMVKEGFITD